MSDIFVALDQKTKEIEQLKLREAKLRRDAQAALTYVKQKVPLPELMDKMHEIELVFPKLERIEKEFETQCITIGDIKQVLPKFIQAEEVKTMGEIIKLDMITYVDEKFKSFRSECFTQIDQKVSITDYQDKIQYLLNRKEFDRMSHRITTFEDEMCRVRDVLYNGFKKEAEYILESKMDKRDLESFLSDKYDVNSGKKNEEDIKKLRNVIKSMDMMIRELQENQRKPLEEHHEEVIITQNTQSDGENKYKTTQQQIKELKEQICDLRDMVYNHKDELDVLRDMKLLQNAEKIARTLKDAEDLTSKLKDIVKKYDQFLLFIGNYNKQVGSFNNQMKDLGERIQDLQNQFSTKITLMTNENDRLGKRVLYLEREQGAMHQDLESHKIFKRKQVDHMVNELNELRDFKTSFLKKCEVLGINIEGGQNYMNKQFNLIDKQIQEIKEPLMREIRNVKKENESLLNEIKRTQNMNREIISDYFKLMDTKIKGNEETFISIFIRLIQPIAQLQQHQEDFMKNTARRKLASSILNPQSQNQDQSQLQSSRVPEHNSSLLLARNSPQTSMSNRTKMGFSFATNMHNAATSNRKRAGTSIQESRNMMHSSNIMTRRNKNHGNQNAQGQSQDSTERKSQLLDFSVMSSLNQNVKNTSEAHQVSVNKHDALKQYTNFPTNARDTRNKEYLDKKHLRKKTFERVAHQNNQLLNQSNIGPKNQSLLLKIEDNNFGMNVNLAQFQQSAYVWPSDKHLANHNIPKTAQHNSRRNVMKDLINRSKNSDHILNNGLVSEADAMSQAEYLSQKIITQTHEISYNQQKIDEEPKEWDLSENQSSQKFIQTLKQMRHNRNQTEVQMTDIIKPNKKSPNKQIQCNFFFIQSIIEYELRRFGHLFSKDQQP
ncbi:UNKNOWN [Stylonychia lemnae]|uniref:Uncharacterized protein n=1 Tax=Stylonychia lemnae TaxID=5949 RepID=A0A078AC53_STYLE|nr:UNKNOWN [Stylonychia lemnae]|eukprot:CDW78363.1 UNKNOWN [Stylonychia lemnae]